MSNELRAEVDMRLGEKTYPLKFTCGALAWLADTHQYGLPDVNAALALGSIPIDKMGLVIEAGMRHLRDKAPSREVIDAEVEDGFLGDLQLPIIEALARALAPNPTELARVTALLDTLFPTPGTGEPLNTPPTSADLV